MAADGGRIPEATINRLPLYLRVLAGLDGETGMISSEELAGLAGVQAAQVRKDLSYLGSYGTRGVGYDVTFLLRQMSRRLGLDCPRRVAIVGVGNLGRALASYGGFAARGFEIVAAFDSDPTKVGGAVGSTLVTPSSEMERVLSEEGVDVGIVTVPAPAAQGVADALVRAGVSAILNFAPISVVVPPSVALRQVDLGIELQILVFHGQRAQLASKGA
jgi:redox-sensing transcriptional repressor